MKKILLIITILLAMCLAALLVFLLYLSAAENGPGAAPSTETTLPGISAPDSNAPLGSEPEKDPQATGDAHSATDDTQSPSSDDSAQPDETTAPTAPEDTTEPTLDPDLDENETPRLEF